VDLDFTYPDERLVAEILAYRIRHPDVSIALVTGDTGPMLAAKRHGLPYIEIPDEWLLPVPRDENDQRIAKLTRRITTLESVGPQIDAVALDATESEITRLVLEVATLRQFTAREIEEFTNEAIRLHPMQTEFRDHTGDHDSPLSAMRGLQQQWVPPGADQIAQYQQQEYPDWVARVRKFFADLPTTAEQPNRQKTLRFEIENIGSRPAEHVQVEFRASGGVVFASSDAKDPSAVAALTLPHPPTPPAGRWINPWLTSVLPTQFGAPMLDLPDIKLGRPRDRNAFYWRNKPERESTRWVFECEEFRHQTDPETFECVVLVSGRKVNNGVIECTVSAANLPQPYRLKVPVTISYTERDAVKTARNLLIPRAVIDLLRRDASANPSKTGGVRSH
jgi:hypothetical protein